MPAPLTFSKSVLATGKGGVGIMQYEPTRFGASHAAKVVPLRTMVYGMPRGPLRGAAGAGRVPWMGELHLGSSR